MATSCTPALIDALVAACSAAASVVTDGRGVMDDPGTYLMVGVDDPDAGSLTDAADARFEWAGLGNHARNQEGDLWLCAGAVSGDSQKAARDAAYAVMAAVETVVRNDPSVSSVLNAGWALTSSERLQQTTSKRGFRARVAFQLRYKTRL